MDETENPRREGDFLIYAEAVDLGHGVFAAYYRVDHHPAGWPLLRTAVQRRRFGQECFDTPELALRMAFTAGQLWVRTLVEE